MKESLRVLRGAIKGKKRRTWTKESTSKETNGWALNTDQGKRGKTLKRGRVKTKRRKWCSSSF